MDRIGCLQFSMQLLMSKRPKQLPFFLPDPIVSALNETVVAVHLLDFLKIKGLFIPVIYYHFSQVTALAHILVATTVIGFRPILDFLVGIRSRQTLHMTMSCLLGNR